MPKIAAAEPMVVEVLDAYRVAGRAWVLVPEDDPSGAPVAYTVLEEFDGAAHVEQLSVDPAFARRGLGRQLLDHVAFEARVAGRTAVTLTTFRDVPWNAPYYERCGFRTLAEPELGPELRAKRDAETAHGLDPALRVCMRRDL
jgi:GNAT superfamily N-acetyltransferase